MQTPKSSQTHNLELGLKAITLSSDQKIYLPPSSTSYSSSNYMRFSPPSSSLMGDYIGMESCVDLRNNAEIHDTHSEEDDGIDQAYSRRKCKRDRRWEMKKTKNKKEFPPPIPSLARTGNLHSHMPWVLKRYYTSDGRLIIREEKVRRHEYFRAHRANGRLTLHLVPLDDDVPASPSIAGDPEEDEITDETAEAYDDQVKDGDVDDHDDDIVGEEKEDEDRTVVELSSMKLNPSSVSEPCLENGIGSNGAGKCVDHYSLKMRSSSSCMFGMAVPSIRPVHT